MNEQKSTNSNKNSNDGDKEKRESAPFRIHDRAHKRKDCPNIYRNKLNSNGRSVQSSSSASSSKDKCKKGEVKSTEGGRKSSTKTPLVCFQEPSFKSDDKSVDSEASCGELMDISANFATTTATKKKNLHPITVITLLNKDQQRIACEALLGQCCTDSGWITWELADMLGLPMTSSKTRSFITAAGTFATNDTLRISDAMLPCLSSNQTFTIELMVIPKQCSVDMNYRVIIGQESMQLLDLDTSIRDNTISWGDQSISMVP